MPSGRYFIRQEEEICKDPNRKCLQSLCGE